MKDYLKVVVFSVIWALLMVVGTKSKADELPQVWLNVGGMSHHFARGKGYNEDNHGLGLELRLNESTSLIAGQYFNSVRHATAYLGATWQPLALGSLRLGASGGIMNGYPNMNRGSAFFAAIPMASVEYHRVGVNVGVIPTVGKVDGAIILQLKFKAF